MILAVLVTFHRRMTHLHPPSTYHLYLALSLATIPTYLLSPLSCCGKRSPRSWHLALAMFSTMQIVVNFAKHRLRRSHTGKHVWRTEVSLMNWTKRLSVTFIKKILNSSVRQPACAIRVESSNDHNLSSAISYPHLLHTLHPTATLIDRSKRIEGSNSATPPMEHDGKAT